MAKSAWGIELGTSSVKAVKLSGDGGGVSLETFSIISLSDYGLGAGVSREAAMAGALSALRAAEGIRKGDQVFVSLTGQNTLGRIISLPPVAKDRVRETIQNEARSQIPIKLEEAVWDYQVIEESEGEEELKVNLYAAKKEVVQQLLEACDAAGLPVTGVQVAPLGIYNYIKYEFDDSVADGCVAIDIGADNTDVVLIDGQKTYVRVVPVAGNEITKALRQRFKLSVDDAEKLKRNAGKSKDAAAVFEAMKPPLKDMVGEIYRAVGFYKNQNEAANISKLVMMGNGSKLLNIKKFFEQQLQYEVHKVEAPQRITLSRTVDAAEVGETIQSLTVAIGLALQGLGVDGVNTINLLPPEYVQGKQVARLRVPFFVGGGLALAGGLIALAVVVISSGGVDGALQQAADTKAAAATEESQFSKHKNLGDAAAKARALRALEEGVLGELPGPEGTPGRQFTVDIGAVPGLLMRAVDDAVAAACTQSSVPVYRVNASNWMSGSRSQMFATGVNGLLSVDVVPDAGLEKKTFSQERTYTYQVYLGSALSSGVSLTSAQELLKKMLLEEPALLTTHLRNACMGYLKESKQLENISAADQQKIKFEFDPATGVYAGQLKEVEFKELYSGKAEMKYRSGTRPDEVRDVTYPNKFALSFVKAVLIIRTVRDAADEAAEPKPPG